MNSTKNAFEPLLYLLAFSLALGMRFLQLGALPLADSEAVWALQALQLARGGQSAVGSQPAYAMLTAGLMYLAGAGNFAARFWPAVSGSLLVFLPLFFRKELGTVPAAILSLFLAFDPGLVAVSRQAGSPVIALASLLFASGLWRASRPQWAGISAGLAVLSGAWGWFGMFVLALTWAVRQVLGSAPMPNPKTKRAVPPQTLSEGLRISGVYALGTVLFAGSLLFLSPGGIGAAFAGIFEFIRGWWTPSFVPAWQLLVALLAYHPLAIVLALVAVVRGWREDSQHERFLAAWALAALVLALVYPARQVSLLVWLVLPLWALSALEIARHLDFHRQSAWEIAGMTTLTLTILIFVWFDLAGMAYVALNSNQALLRLIVAGIALVLLGLSAVLVGLGWSVRSARLGLVWGALIVFGVYTLSSSVSAAGGLRASGSVELWHPQPQVRQASLLTRTLGDLSEWNTGGRQSLPVVVWEVNSPALQWLLRDLEYRTTSLVSAAETPQLVITSGVRTDLGLSAAYRGQDFTWRSYPNWTSILPNDWLRWIVLRQFPQTDENIILWARLDLFLDGSDQPAVP